MQFERNDEGLPICPVCHETMLFTSYDEYRDSETMGGHEIDYVTCSNCGEFSMIENEVYPLDGNILCQ